ncbi:hypothetical protein ACS0TY_034603 [Phlomoides rotata]
MQGKMVLKDFDIAAEVDFKPPAHHKEINSIMVARVIAGGVFFLSLVLGILRKKGYLGGKSTTEITFLHQGGPIIFSQHSV